MNNLIKSTEFDILMGLKEIKIGLSNIIFIVVNTKEDCTITLPINLSTLKDLIELTIVDNYQVPQLCIQNKANGFVIYCEEFNIVVSKEELKYTFHLLK